MKAAKVISLLIYLFITGPIWFYLFYKILEAVNASELMWFLYWVYVPISIVLGAIARLTED